jgi:hypothetical protein
MEQIKNRFTGEIMCGGLSLKVVLEKHKKWRNGDKDGTRADFTDADFTGADLTGANLTRAYLERANFTDADLTGANFTDAYLAGANFTDADFTGVKAYGYTFYKPPLQVSDKYNIEIWEGFMKVGCEKHTLAEWSKFTQKQIIEMDGKDAATWWKKWKPVLFALAKAGDRMELPEQPE